MVRPKWRALKGVVGGLGPFLRTVGAMEGFKQAHLPPRFRYGDVIHGWARGRGRRRQENRREAVSGCQETGMMRCCLSRDSGDVSSCPRLDSLVQESLSGQRGSWGRDLNTQFLPASQMFSPDTPMTVQHLSIGRYSECCQKRNVKPSKAQILNLHGVLPDR